MHSLLHSLAIPISTQHQAAEGGYDPRRSKVSDRTMEEWRQRQITGDLTEVPGIGPATAMKLMQGELQDDQITNTYMLFGKVYMKCNMCNV